MSRGQRLERQDKRGLARALLSLLEFLHPLHPVGPQPAELPAPTVIDARRLADLPRGFAQGPALQRLDVRPPKLRDDLLRFRASFGDSPSSIRPENLL